MIAIVRITSLTVMRRILPWFFGHFSPALAAGAALIETTGPRAHLPAPRFLPVGAAPDLGGCALLDVHRNARSAVGQDAHAVVDAARIPHPLPGLPCTPWLGFLPATRGGLASSPPCRGLPGRGWPSWPR